MVVCGGVIVWGGEVNEDGECGSVVRVCEDGVRRVN